MKLPRVTPIVPRNASDWTRERIERLGRQEVDQLRANAEALGEAAIAELCAEVLKTMPKRAAAGGAAGAVKNGRHLVSRTRAFEARGVFLQDTRGSWSGVRKSDGTVVMTIWAKAVESGDGSCSYLLWAPNVGGSRPWSDKAAGRERLEHCRLALKQGGAEGLLVYGERLEGHLPEDKARTVQGVDPETVLRFKVEARGEEYWAVWGRKAERAAA
ncbi:MAG TPA: hypothetical protein VFZ81_07850 [Burkholderiales bacterium]